MKKIAVSVCVAAMIVSTGLVAGDAGYAEEDGVPAEEMKQYIEDCVADLKSAETEAGSDEESSGGSSAE